MGVKCIFYVNSVKKNASGSHEVDLRATAKGDYAAYSKYTPSGQWQFTSLNDNATAFFEERIGKDVAILITDPTEADLITPNAA